MTRVPERYRFDSTQNRINLSRSFADDVQQTAVSGRKLKKISDDPVGSTKVLRNRSKINNIKEFKKTIDFANGYLQKSEDSLRGISEALIRAKELSIQQANGTWDEKTRDIVSHEVRQLGDQVVELGNSTFSDKYVFGGFRSSSPPVDSDGNFLGDDGVIFIQVSGDFFRPINVSGRELFEVNLDNEKKALPLVQIFRQLETSLQNNNLESIHSLMAKIDYALENVVSLTASLGAKRNNLEGLEKLNDRDDEQTQIENNQLESADFVKSALDLKKAENSLEYTLTSSSKLLSPTLLNFLGPS